MYYTEYCQGKGLLLNILPINMFTCKQVGNENLQYISFRSLCQYNDTGAINMPQDSFIKSPENLNIRVSGFTKNPKLKNCTNCRFELEKYNSLKRHEKEFIMNNMNDGIKALAAENIGIGLAIKQELDKRYGEGNYKFISLGTSPACAAKVMELTGVDVVYLPMSYAHSTCTKTWLKQSPYIDFYKSYMASKGLSNEILQKEGKRGIICDYTITGRSLELSEFMLKEPLGLDENLLDTYTMNSLIEESSCIPNDFKDKYLNELLKNEKTASYCDVAHFSFIDKSMYIAGKIKDSKSLAQYFDSYHAPYSNAHNFCVMKLLEDGGYLGRPN